MILVGKGDIDRRLKVFTQGIPVFRFEYKPVYLCNLKRSLTGHYSFLRGKNVLAFSGLGDNKSFFDFLRRLGANVKYEISFPDHYYYGEDDIIRLLRYENVEIIVTTEKDALKINKEAAPDNLYYLTIEAEIENEEKMMLLIQKKLSAVSSQLSAIS